MKIFGMIFLLSLAFCIDCLIDVIKGYLMIHTIVKKNREKVIDNFKHNIGGEITQDTYLKDDDFFRMKETQPIIEMIGPIEHVNYINPYIERTRNLNLFF